MRKGRGRQLTDGQWMTVAGAVLIAVFMTAMGIGAGNINLVLVALLLLVLVAVGVVLIGYRQADPPVPGQGRVVWASAAPTKSIVGTCEMELDVALGDSPPVRVRVRAGNTPVHKWPRRGMVLPLEASVRRPDKPKIFWDRVAPRGTGGPEAPEEAPAPPPEDPPGPPTAYIPPVFTAFRADAGAPPRDEAYYDVATPAEPDHEPAYHLVPPAPGAEADPDLTGATPAGGPWQSPPGARPATG
ncbi:hypothetical protein, partial [Luedemannella flava]|uniref:hypothetical protein n=1 Tax=Luedemannella flava TaxID=349316 RepID=UPI0031CE5B6F